jgi:hypothetical protein
VLEYRLDNLSAADVLFSFLVAVMDRLCAVRANHASLVAAQAVYLRTAAQRLDKHQITDD